MPKRCCQLGLHFRPEWGLSPLHFIKRKGMGWDGKGGTWRGELCEVRKGREREGRGEGERSGC